MLTKSDRHKMTIFRTCHDVNNPYVILNKQFLRNPDLSAKAKGILAYLLSCPDNWETRTDNLIAVMRDGRDSILAGLRELEDGGYFEKKAVRDVDTGRILYWVKNVYETPQVFEATKHQKSQDDLLSLQTGLPDQEKPLPVNPTLIINKRRINNKSKREADSLSVITDAKEADLLHTTGNKSTHKHGKQSKPPKTTNLPRRDNKSPCQQDNVEKLADYALSLVSPNDKQGSKPVWASHWNGRKWIPLPEFAAWYQEREKLTAAQALNFLAKPSNAEATLLTYEEYREDTEKTRERGLAAPSSRIKPSSSRSGRKAPVKPPSSSIQDEVTPSSNFQALSKKLKAKQIEQQTAKQESN